MLAMLVRVPEIDGTFLEVGTLVDEDQVSAALDDISAVFAEPGIGRRTWHGRPTRARWRPSERPDRCSTPFQPGTPGRGRPTRSGVIRSRRLRRNAASPGCGPRRRRASAQAWRVHRWSVSYVTSIPRSIIGADRPEKVAGDGVDDAQVAQVGFQGDARAQLGQLGVKRSPLMLILLHTPCCAEGPPEQAA
ncbi:hypothetical protein [Streptomyces sp. NPDC047706]|uniref:hypothetical protein n=1 Tax=Streptomyces sp. NPDC047706 TaxID=3365486 RepID=UPI0037225AD9